MEEVASKPEHPLEPGKYAIVVGASSGIGQAVAQELARRDYSVALVARRERRLAEACQAINASSANGARARYYTHSVADFSDVPGLFQQIVADLGGLDLLVYASGVQSRPSEDDYDFEQDVSMVNVNLLGAMAWISQAGLRFDRAGKGHIVGISSIAAVRGRRLNPGYHASKAGFDTYLESMRNRLARRGVTVTTIRPGFVDTALLENATSTFWVITPAEAAEQIFRAIKSHKQIVYVPRRWLLMATVIRSMPSFLFRRLSF